MKIGVTSPLYINNWNHRDYLNKTTESIQTSHEWYWIPVYNYLAPQFLPYAWHFTQHPTEIHIVAGRQPQSVAKGWNDGIRKAIELGCEYILVTNDDIILKSDAIDRIVEFAQNHPEAIFWSLGQCNDLYNLEQTVNDPTSFAEHPNFSCFLIHKSFPEVFGLFDENFVPAFHEDNDAHARMALANQKAYTCSAAWFFHFASQTIRSDPELALEAQPGIAQGRAYFMEKWGCGIVNDVDEMRRVYFQHPYNQSDKPLSFWRGVEEAGT